MFYLFIFVYFRTRSHTQSQKAECCRTHGTPSLQYVHLCWCCFGLLHHYLGFRFVNSHFSIFLSTDTKIRLPDTRSSVFRHGVRKWRRGLSHPLAPYKNKLEKPSLFCLLKFCFVSFLRVSSCSSTCLESVCLRRIELVSMGLKLFQHWSICTLKMSSTGT